MYELWYWCQQRGEFLRLEGPDWPDFETAAAHAQALVAHTGRVIRVVDMYSNEVLYQSGMVEREFVANPAYW